LNTERSDFCHKIAQIMPLGWQKILYYWYLYRNFVVPKRSAIMV
jgi:hypothetical protein